MKADALHTLPETVENRLNTLPQQLLTGWFVLRALLLHVASFFGVSIVHAGGLHSPTGAGIIVGVSLVGGVGIGLIAGSLSGVIAFGLTAGALLVSTLIAKEVLGDDTVQQPLEVTHGSS